MSFRDFILKWNKKYLEFDGAYWYQCVDLTKAWQHNLGLSVTRGNAIQWPNNASKTDYTWIKNALNNKPNPGDIVVFNIGYYGHIGICTSANYINLTCFEQNSPLGSPCHFVTHYYYRNVLGWLRPRHY